MKIKIYNEEIKDLLGAKTFDFPKYSTQVINLANQNAQGTRPAIVGQMSELIQEFTGQTIDEWENWYLQSHPDAIEKATDRIYSMVENLREVINEIDRQMVERWVYDLVVSKTFVGLKFQGAILARVAQHIEVEFRLADIYEEAKGIDGYLGDTPVSIKPETYKTKPALREGIDAKFIYYDKKKDGIVIDLTDFF